MASTRIIRRHLVGREEAPKMSTPERRIYPRFQISRAVALAVPETVALHGQAMNASKRGILLEAHGRLTVRVTIDGREYDGWLARAYRVDRNTFAYAIELDASSEMA